MFRKIGSFGVHGVEGYFVTVEMDFGDGFPGLYMIGSLSEEVKEAADRVRTSLKNCGFRIPPKKVVVNLSPAGIKKDGTAFDLAIAAAVLSFFIPLPPEAEEWAFFGELGLDGSVKPVPGTLPRVYEAKRQHIRRVFLPEANAAEGACVEGVEVVGIRTLRELADCLEHPSNIEETRLIPEKCHADDKIVFPVDYSELAGLPTVKRACLAAAAGHHNLLLIGPSGTGKTMAAERLPTILPPMTLEEKLEISRVYSILGLLCPEQPLVEGRPFRNPHHSITPRAMTGGGSVPMPGELSLASGGVLFLDELPEFNPRVLDLLRQPMEDGFITVTRASGSVRFPADALIAAAMNPCRCGYYPDRGKCRCTDQQIHAYLNRISGPFLDRMDIGVEVPRQDPQVFLTKEAGETSESMRNRVKEAVLRQQERFAGETIARNGQMNREQLERFCRLSEEDHRFLEKLCAGWGQSGRGVGKLLKVARTLADLDGCPDIRRSHLAEAMAFRSFENKYWGK